MGRAPVRSHSGSFRPSRGVREGTRHHTVAADDEAIVPHPTASDCPVTRFAILYRRCGDEQGREGMSITRRAWLCGSIASVAWALGATPAAAQSTPEYPAKDIKA